MTRNEAALLASIMHTRSRIDRHLERLRKLHGPDCMTAELFAEINDLQGACAKLRFVAFNLADHGTPDQIGTPA